MCACKVVKNELVDEASFSNRKDTQVAFVKHCKTAIRKLFTTRLQCQCVIRIV